MKFNARSTAFIGVLGALSAALMLINVPLPFTPSFMKFDIAELPGLFAGFFMGPVSGMAVVVVKILLKLMMQGTDTAFVGEFSNLVGSSIFILTAALIYRRYHTKKGAIIGLVISTLVVSVAYVFINAFVMFPLYSTLYGLPMEVIVQMAHAVNPLVNDNITMMLFAVFPFNLVKHGVTSILTYVLYKRVGRSLRSMMEVKPKKSIAR